MMSNNRSLAAGALVILSLSLQGCATYWAERRADKLVTQGQSAEAVTILADLAARDPAHYRVKYVSTRDSVTQGLMQKAQAARRQGQPELALGYFQEILRYDPRHDNSRHGLELIARDRREAELLGRARSAHADGKSEVAAYLVNEILVASPQHHDARELRKTLDIEKNRAQLEEPTLVDALGRPVSLEFRNASLQAILEVLSQSSGLNFIFDREVKADLRTTIFARNTTVKDALNVILRTSQLQAKTLNESTLLIYPATAEKEKQYEDLVVRTFYLGSADPKKAQELVRSMVAPRSLYVDDKMRTLVVRDSLPVIQAVERLLAAYDIAPPEVVLEVEIFEVSKDSLLNVGVQFPDQVKASVFGAANKAGQLTVDELRNLDKQNFQLFLPDPVAVLNLKQTSGKANTLANPRIRVRSLEKARVMIGDKVPVITTTTNQTSTATTESVTYLDVGLKLEVEPEVHVNNEVSISVALEVSNIIKEIKSTTGLLTYQIGTRSANTVLRLRDGETQALAGLIKDEQRDSASHLPGIGKLPLIGRLFSNETNNRSKSEIVLLITPRVVRSLATPDAHMVEFLSGTSAKPSTSAFRLGDASRASATNQKLSEKASPSPASVPRPAPLPAASPATEAPSPVLPVVMVPARAAGTPVRLEVGAPSRVQPGQTFTLPIMIGGEALEEVRFDLAFDSPGLSLLQVTSVATVRQAVAEQRAGGVTVTISGAEAHVGPVAVLSLQAGKKSREPIRLELRNASARLVDGVEVPVQSAAAQEVRIQP